MPKLVETLPRFDGRENVWVDREFVGILEERLWCYQITFPSGSSVRGVTRKLVMEELRKVI